MKYIKNVFLIFLIIFSYNDFALAVEHSRREQPVNSLIQQEREHLNQHVVKMNNLKSNDISVIGENLFVGGYETERYDGLNENYIISPGDKISISLWGAIEQVEILTVDNQGNIFLPGFGPIEVKDKKAGNINQEISNIIRKTYKTNVNVYVELLSTTPVSIFVTGMVARPGQYAGLSADSVIYYLKRAGGIEQSLGSFRKIKIIRNNKVIKKIDLYDFIFKGRLHKHYFKDNDVVFVEKNKHKVIVSGEVQKNIEMEVKNDSPKGRDIYEYAMTQPKVTHVIMTGFDEKPIKKMLTLKKFLSYDVTAFRNFYFFSGNWDEDLTIKINGDVFGKNIFILKNPSYLTSLLDIVSVDTKKADIDSIYIVRKSIALQQKILLDDALNRLEKSFFSSSISSSSEAAIRSSEAKMILEYTQRARNIEPLGIVNVSQNGKIADIKLENEDIVVIPQKTDLIHISGQINIPQALVYHQDATVKDYVAWSGGYSSRANYKNPLIISANKQIKMGPDVSIEPGDSIVILPKIEAKTMQAIKDITQVIYQIAIAANVAL